jgi:transcriptional regulator with XRE-family HTH domain
MKDDKVSAIVEKGAGALWAEKAKFRLQNRKWLGYSGKIALRVLSAVEDMPEMNQKKLAALAGVSPQQISKIVQGKENLTLKTIAKLSDILGVDLITFPSFKYNEIDSPEITVNGNIYVRMNVLLFPHQNFVFFSQQKDTMALNGLTFSNLETSVQTISI